MKSYDLLLVVGFFRSATAYLSIIRHLSPTLRIGVLPARVDPSVVAKSPRTQALFLELCARFGAELVPQGTPVEAGLLVVQQFPYPEATVAEIRATLRAKRRVALLGLASAGLEKQDAFLAAFGLPRGYVPNKRLFQFLVRRRGGEQRYSEVEIEQVGLPFARYPVFPEFRADYLIAAPTPFSFRKETHKHAFVADVLSLLDQVPSTDVVVYKPHNAVRRDYFTPRAYAQLGGALARIPLGHALARAAAGRVGHPAKRHLESIYTAVLHARLLQRALPMSAATPYSGISLEAFLPGVRKGVIGGLSNTIWGSLYFGLPFYNCVDPEERDQHEISEIVTNKVSTHLLDLNLEFFGVPYCGGDLAQGATGHGIVVEEDCEGDLIEAILADLDAPAQRVRYGS